MPNNDKTPVFVHNDRGATVTISKGNNRPDIYRKRPALKAVDDRSSEIFKSVDSKLIGENRPKQYLNDKEKNNIDVDQGYVKAISDDTALSVAEANSMLDALPDLELSKLIIVSSILSPNDMISNKLIYGCNTDLFKELTSPLVSVIENYFNDSYKIKKQLPEMIGKAIFTDGAYPMIILPEASIDELINSNLTVTSESFNNHVSSVKKPLGILGNPKNPISKAAPRKGEKKTIVSAPARSVTLSFESIASSVDSSNFIDTVGHADFNTTITDNPSVLRIPRLVEKVRHQAILSKYGAYSISGETFGNTLYSAKIDKKSGSTSKELGNLYPTRKSAFEPTLTIKDPLTLDRESVGDPVVLTPPSEACIPVYEPGDPSHHVGYFIVLDETGNPIGASAHEDQFKNLATYTNSSSSSQSINSTIGTSLTTQYKQMAGITSNISQGEEDNSVYDPVKAAEMYGSIIENELVERLENGTYANKLTVAKANDIYRMMFTRACMAMKTQIIYVPAEFVSYLAYDYKRNGIGRSLLERTKAIGSLRMINMMSKALASIKSSTNLRRLEIVVDPDDPAPLKTVEQRIHEFMQATKAEFPIGQMNFADITDSLQKAGISVHVTGTDRLPETSMELDYRNVSVTPPDEEYDNALQRQQIMGFGIPPDAVNSATDMQFATAIVTYNFLSAKINLMRQEITCECLSDFIRKYSMHSKTILDRLERVITENREMLDTNEMLKGYDARALAKVFINHIEVHLPEANLSKLEAEMEAYDKYEESLDKILEAFISEEMFTPELVGSAVADKMRDIKPVVKNYFLRRYLADNNVMPELFEIIAVGENDGSDFDLFTQSEEYMNTLMPAFRRFILRMLKSTSRNEAVFDTGVGIIEEINKLRGYDEEVNNILGNSGDTNTDDAGDDNDDPFTDDSLGDDADGDFLPDDIDGDDDGDGVSDDDEGGDDTTDDDFDI